VEIPTVTYSSLIVMYRYFIAKILFLLKVCNLKVCNLKVRYFGNCARKVESSCSVIILRNFRVSTPLRCKIFKILSQISPRFTLNHWNMSFNTSTSNRFLRFKLRYYYKKLSIFIKNIIFFSKNK